VHHHDIPGTDERSKGFELACRGGSIVAAFGIPQRATIAEDTVEPVVDPFRDLEERWLRLDHEPARWDPIVCKVPEVGTEDLSDATTLDRGIDVPHTTIAQSLPRFNYEVVVSRTCFVPDHRAKAFGWSARHRHLEHLILLLASVGAIAMLLHRSVAFHRRR